jgi:photosystem II stability/assembly factor-like uncharacterized protein
MRFGLPLLGGLLALAAAAEACGAGDARPVTSAPRVPTGAAPVQAELPPMPPQYVLAEPAARGAAPAILPLDRADVFGVILDGLRIVMAGAGVRAARDVADPAVVNADRVPRWLGGGFLFRSANALYLSDAFDGALRPVVTLPSNIERVSFGPKFALVRATTGERWAIELPSGQRAPLLPAGLADVAAVEGRAAAMTDFGSVLVSTDGGAKWADVTAQLRGKPERVSVVEDAVWIVEAGGAALRVDGDRLSLFDRAPATKPPELRVRDPRWRGDEAPIRRAIRLGTPVDDQTALVVTEGDVVRVNVTTGEIVSATPGRLPPDATCEAFRAQDEVVLACTRPSGGSFVASHLGGEKSIAIEQTFAASGTFYAGDDGALAFGGPCTRPKATHLAVCVRTSGGSWQELDIEPFVADAGPGTDVVRWIPRADGGAFGLVGGPQAGLVDGRTGELRPWAMDNIPPQAKTALADARARSSTHRIVDRLWTTTPSGGLRGWTESGAAIEVPIDGAVSVSPFAFDRVATAGPFALARSRDGRVWQTTDRGASWNEVAAPPSAQPTRNAQDVRACSAVGCDLGTWYRVGWLATAPAPSVPMAVAPPAARLPRPALPQIACRRAGDAKTTSVARTDDSPEDLGLGAARLPIGNESGTIEYARAALGRVIINPPHGATEASDSEYGAVRVVHHGFRTDSGTSDERFMVLAPEKDAMSLRRSVAFVAPFDVSSTVWRTTFGTTELVAAAKGAGLRAADVLREDMTPLSFLAPATPLDPAASGDLVAGSALGAICVLRGAPARVRVAVRPHADDDAAIVSAAQLPQDALAILELDSAGKGAVYKLAAGGITDLFEVPAPPRGALYPANPDAVATGPRSEIATLRIASGGDPASELDPAVLSLPGAPPLALAPWSTLKTADTPECRAETGGWRATIATTKPWVRISGDAKLMDDAPMFARVRWSAQRVCLEALEVRLADTDTNVLFRSKTGGRGEAVAPQEASLETWLVARFTGTPGAARTSIVPGLETRQPMTCSL